MYQHVMSYPPLNHSDDSEDNKDDISYLKTSQSILHVPHI